MAIVLTDIRNLDSDPHHYRAVEPTDPGSFLAEAASEYRRLRAQTVVPLTEDDLSGIQGFNLAGLRRRLISSGVPVRRDDNFDVNRSDLGETIAYMVLEQVYGTTHAYKSIRDRESVDLPGRGIDAVGVEHGDPVVLVLGEVKVSADADCPPGVVDADAHSLRNQHQGHLQNTAETCRKLWHLVRLGRNRESVAQLVRAAEYLERGDMAKVRVVTFSLMVRPQSYYDDGDYGSFRASPSDYSPSAIRFWIVCMPEGIDETVDRWHQLLSSEEADA